MYYLQSRYYDPKIGRFLNADAYTSTGQGILGNNMFAYCGNNPVVRADATGSAYYVLGIDSGSPMMNIQLRGMGGGGGPMIVPASRSESLKVIEREQEYFNNTSEQVVLESSCIAFYYGVPVFRTDLGNGGGASFGIILLDDNYVFDDYGIRTLKHEYGHRLHFDEIGADTYLVTTAIPSLIFAGLTNEGIFPQEYYYSLPWEYVADMYGGVNRGRYGPYAAENAAIFWTATIIASR